MNPKQWRNNWLHVEIIIYVFRDTANCWYSCGISAGGPWGETSAEHTATGLCRATWVVQRELQFSRIHWCHVRGWLWQTNKWFSKFICLNWKGRALKFCAGPSNIQPANSIRNHFVHVWMMSVPTISHTKNQPHGKNWSMAKRLVLPLSSSHSSSLWKRCCHSCSLQVFSWVPSNVGGEMVFLIDTLNESALSKTLQCLRAPEKRGKCLYHTCWKNHI